MNKKIVFLPYDFDTAIGINNEGALVFSYNLEDIDQTESGADVYNGQQSVLWKNVRAAFGDELKTMYQNLRSQGKISYPIVEGMFENHQNKWPEAIFNEDAWFKYLQPLVDDGDASYLSMLQGSKAEQRKWWLYNRFRYMDSKYNAGDALSDVITIRAYAKSNVTITPYADVYATVKYGSYVMQTRAARNNSYVIVCPVDNLNDTEVYIYSASQLSSVGDLSGFKVGYANFSMATKLQSLKLGDSDQLYDNGNLTELYLGNNELLRTLDIRNCSNLTQPVDVSGCKNIEHVYFDGTAITGLSLPNGGILKTLHLPNTITNLTIRNQNGITDFVIASGASISTLRLENVSNAVNSKALLMSMLSGSRVRLIGFSWSVDDYDEADDLYDILDGMRGLDESGGNVDTAQMLGTLHVPSLTGEQLASLNERYHDISITYDHITTTLNYYNWEGDTLLYSETVNDGGDGTYAGQPTHAPTAQYTFEFSGWALTSRASSANPNATKEVNTNRNVYAAYILTGQLYRVRFYNGSTLLQTVNDVAYGSTAAYTGETPIYTEDPDNFEFSGWSPSNENITGNTDCYAQYLDLSSDLVKYLSGTMTEWVNDTVDDIASYAFYRMDSLQRIETEASTIHNMAFYGCSELRHVDLKGSELTLSGSQVFDDCYKLESVIIRKDDGLITLRSSLPFETSPFLVFNGAMYVPSLLVSSYKEADYFRNIASRILPISEYPVSIDYFDTISDTWSEIIAASNNGTYSTRYSIGDTKTLVFGSSYVTMVLIAMDADAKTGSNDTAHMTWLAKWTIDTHSMNSTNTNAGGWAECSMRSWLANDILTQFPSELQTGIVVVDKTYYDHTTTSTLTCSDRLWIPSAREVNISQSLEDSGVDYSSYFTGNSTRTKYLFETRETRSWWLRSSNANNSTTFRIVGAGGILSQNSASTVSSVLFGFCI